MTNRFTLQWNEEPPLGSNPLNLPQRKIYVYYNFDYLTGNYDTEASRITDESPKEILYGSSINVSNTMISIAVWQEIMPNIYDVIESTMIDCIWITFAPTQAPTNIPTPAPTYPGNTPPPTEEPTPAPTPAPTYQPLNSQCWINITGFLFFLFFFFCFLCSFFGHTKYKMTLKHCNIETQTQNTNPKLK